MERALSPLQKSLMLIVDKNDFLGLALGEKLAKEATVVLVSKTEIAGQSSVLHVPFTSLVPRIPEGEYTHIILVWNKEDQHLFEPLSRAAKQYNAKFFVVISSEEKEELGSFAKTSPQLLTALVLGDLFGDGKKSALTTFLQKAKATKHVSLPSMGLHVWHPILFSDAIAKIAEHIAGAKSPENKAYFVGPAHGITALSLSHGIQKIDPDILIDFSNDTTPGNSGPGKSEHSLFVEYDSVAKVQKFYQHLVVKKEVGVKEGSTAFPQKKVNKKKHIPRVFYIAYVLGIMFFLPIIVTLISGGLSVFLLKGSLGDAKAGNVQNALQKARAAQSDFILLQSSLDVVGKELGIFGQGNSILPLEREAKLGYQISQITEQGILLSQNLFDILSGKTLSPKDASSNVINTEKQLSVLVQQVSMQDVPIQYQSTFLGLKKLTSIASGIIDEFPQIVGVNGDKSYLILFQNNMELRPGGGFIGSYGILKLSKGAVKEFSIHDVYDADGQLKGHVEPPFAIRRYIPIVHLYLRDSNFDPDFTKNAQTAAFLLSQETGEKVDGVVGVDLDALKGILASIGSVYVPSYNQTITENNFFLTIEQHVQKNTFPGSTQKKDFLNAFFSAFVEKLQKKQDIDASTLLTQVATMLTEKHVVVGFSDPFIETPFLLADLSGSLTDMTSSQSGTLSDFFGIVEANLGINKVNAFITRQVSQNVTITDSGSVLENVSLVLNNTSDGTWPGGEYRNYIRFILPQAAILQSIAFNNVEQHIVDAVTDPRIYEGKGFVPPKGLEVARETESGKVLYGFLITIPEKSATTITITYELSTVLSTAQLQSTYDLQVWKQVGIPSYPYNLSVTIPNSMRFLDGSIPVNKNSQTTTYTTNVAGDMDMQIPFSAK